MLPFDASKEIRFKKTIRRLLKMLLFQMKSGITHNVLQIPILLGPVEDCEL